MIELVLLGSLVLLGLHFLTRGRQGGGGAAPPPNRPRGTAAAPAVHRPRPRKEPRPAPPQDAPGGAEFEIVYGEAEGAPVTRRISGVRPESVGGAWLIHCRCEDAGREVTLENDRILSCRNLRSGRAIKNLARYCQARSPKTRP